MMLNASLVKYGLLQKNTLCNCVHNLLYKIKRGSYVSAQLLLNLLNKVGKLIKCEACQSFYLLFTWSLINSIIQESEC